MAWAARSRRRVCLGQPSAGGGAPAGMVDGFLDSTFALAGGFGARHRFCQLPVSRGISKSRQASPAAADTRRPASARDEAQACISAQLLAMRGHTAAGTA